MKDIKGKAVVVTGGAVGIGKALTYRFLAEGSRVAIIDINQSQMEKTRDEFSSSGDIKIFRCDLAQREQVYETAARIKNDFGPVDILVNNAGILNNIPFMNKPDEIIQKTIAVNLLASCWLIKSFLPDMISKRSGYIVTIASAGGLLSSPYTIDYCASKHAVIGLIKGLRQEMKLFGHSEIRFLYVCPTIVNTDMVKNCKSETQVKQLMPEWVAKKTVDAVKKGKQVLYLPGIVRLIPILEAILSVDAVDKYYLKSGIATSMQPTK